MIYQYKITKDRQFRNARKTIIWFFILIILFTISIALYHELTSLLILLFSIYILFDIIPAILIHLDYYYINKHDILSYDSCLDRFVFIHGLERVVFKSKDIVFIKIVLSYPTGRDEEAAGGTYDRYSHAIFFLKNKVTIVVTSLMLDYNSFKIFNRAKKVSIKKGLFRWVRYPSLRNN